MGNTCCVTKKQALPQKSLFKPPQKDKPQRKRAFFDGGTGSVEDKGLNEIVIEVQPDD